MILGNIIKNIKYRQGPFDFQISDLVDLLIEEDEQSVSAGARLYCGSNN